MATEALRQYPRCGSRRWSHRSIATADLYVRYIGALRVVHLNPLPTALELSAEGSYPAQERREARRELPPAS
jgi:hypothetical protein